MTVPKEAQLTRSSTPTGPDEQKSITEDTLARNETLAKTRTLHQQIYRRLAESFSSVEHEYLFACRRLRGLSPIYRLRLLVAGLIEPKSDRLMLTPRDYESNLAHYRSDSLVGQYQDYLLQICIHDFAKLLPFLAKYTNQYLIDYRQAALHAVLNNSSQVMSKLIELGLLVAERYPPRPQLSIQFENNRLLRTAVEQDNLLIAQLLIEGGANVNEGNLRVCIWRRAKSDPMRALLDRYGAKHLHPTPDHHLRFPEVDGDSQSSSTAEHITPA